MKFVTELSFSALTKAKIFARFVDEIIGAVKCNKVDALFLRANKIHFNLQFTIEREEKNATVSL